MQCNQAFCGNGFNNGPFCNSYNTPLQSNQSMYPEIVGEGQVTSITLPDGSVQFFFMPTIKWKSPYATQCHPFGTIPYPTQPNPMFANNNYSIPPQCNNNVGSWFIRSFLPFSQSVFNPSIQRNEFPRLENTDFGRYSNNLDFGYQVKFHNDAWSSTTDLVYFYPSLRQRDFVYKLPCKDKSVQVDTEPVANNTVCHYEPICSKPCNCTCSVPAPTAPMSLECLVDPKSTTKNQQHKQPHINNISADDCCCSKQNNKRCNNKKNKNKKPKNIMWACNSTDNIPSVDKCITTYADEGCGCTPADGCETQTDKPDRADAIRMHEALLKPKWTAKSYSGDTTSDESSICDEKRNKRSKDNAKYNALLTPKWTAKDYSGDDSMSVERSCDESKKRSKDYAKYKAQETPKWTAKDNSGDDSMSVECSCDEKRNKRSKDNAKYKALLTPKWTAKDNSGDDSMSVECSCDEKCNKKSKDNAKYKALETTKWTAKDNSGDDYMSVECSCDESKKKSEDNAKYKALETPKWTTKGNRGDDSISLECSCDDISKTRNNRSEDKPMNEAPLKPEKAAMSCSGYTMSAQCSCDNLSKKPSVCQETQTRRSGDNVNATTSSRTIVSSSAECSCDDTSNYRSEDTANAKPMNKALLGPKWTAKSYSGDSMTDNFSCDDNCRNSKKRVNEHKRTKPKKCDCGCDSADSVSDKTVANEDGRGKPYTNTCSTSSINCCTSVTFKYSHKDIEQKTLLQQVNSDNVWSDCELDEGMRKPLISSKVLDRKSLEQLLDTSCLNFDTIGSACDGSSVNE